MAEIICAVCGKVKKVKPSEIKRGRKYCSTKCGGLAKRGKIPYNKGYRKYKTEPKYCLVCGTKMERKREGYESWKNKKFCCRKCIGIGFSGENNPMYGGHLVPKSKGNHIQTNTGRTHFKKGQIPWNKNKKATIETKIKHSLRQTGETEFNGFISTLTSQIKSSMNYYNWRNNVYKRDNYECQMCGHHGGKLNAHHIKFFNKIFKENNICSEEEAEKCSELWDEDNGITFCQDCHKLYHKYIK